MSRDLRGYLQQPDKLFRRVRDAYGVLRLSQAAKAYHLGRGVYRSSYKNARRLAATETNIAYHTADYLRWQQLDFVVGIRVELSNNHTLNGRPFHDICDELSAPRGSNNTGGRGCYPKDFKFTGWHPLCRCHAVAILKTDEEIAEGIAAILDGNEPGNDSVNKVKDVPQEFKDWLDGNEERIARAKSLPYFLKDNPSILKEYTPEIHNTLAKQAISNAKAAAPDFQKRVEAIAQNFGATVSPINLKSVGSIWRKINSEDEMHIGKVRDLVRNTIIVEDADRISSIIEEIQKRFIIPFGEKGNRA